MRCAEAAMLRPPDAKRWRIRKDPDAQKDWRQEEKGMLYCKPKYKVNIGLFPFFPLISHSIDICIISSVQSVMPSNQIILCHPLLSLPSIFPSIRILYNESVLPNRWLKYWSFTSACASSSPAFLMMCSTCKLNRQGDNIQPWLFLSQFGISPLFHVWF